MSSTILQIISFNILTVLLMTPNNIKAQQCTDATDYCWSCSYSGTFTNTSTYKQNLDSLLSSFTNSSNSNNYGFYNSSRGENSDRVNAIALCRGDMVPGDCRTCIGNVSMKLLQQYCPNRQEAIIWGWSCMVRYSNNRIFSIWEDIPMMPLSGLNFSADEKKYTTVLDPLLDELMTEAASGNSTTKLAYGRRNVLLSDNSVEPIFALLQCTPDLSGQNCSGCLQHSISQIPSCCSGRTGARVLKPSCTLRFEKEIFFNFATEDDSLQPQGKRSNAKRNVVIIVITSIIAMILAISTCIFFIRGKPLKNFPSMEKNSLMESLQFDFSTVEAATDNFSDANKLGEGGFGPVYKGILSDGQYIAVKRLSKTSGQGDLEFKNEVLLVANLQHQNLVRLVGFCSEGIERLLVYEFVPNGSLNQFIFDPTKRRGLDWYKRYKIIGGIARGLVYLHEYSRLKIIHRDLKASNILLDDEMNPKIADFGLARLIALDQTHENASRIAGTYGYMAPEYAMRGYFSVKSDVYSFGILLLEIVSGQKNTFFHESEDASDLLSHVWKNWTERTALNVVDSAMQMQMMRDGNDDAGSRSREIKKCIHIALLCVQENPADRPTMNSIIAMLTNNSDLNLPTPARSQPRNFVYSSNSMITSQSNYSEN